MQHAHRLEQHTKGFPSKGFLARPAPEMLQNQAGATADRAACTHGHTHFTHLPSPGDCALLLFMWAKSYHHGLSVCVVSTPKGDLILRAPQGFWQLPLPAPSYSLFEGEGTERKEQCPAFFLTPAPKFLQFTERFISHKQHTVFRENSRRTMVQTNPLLVKYCPGPTFHLGWVWTGSQPQSIMLGTLAEESSTFHGLAFPSQADVKGYYNTHPASKGLAEQAREERDGFGS